MLVFSRHVSERIVIELPGGPVYVMLVAVKDARKARIGIDAPKEIPVHREEIYERLRSDNRD